MTTLTDCMFIGLRSLRILDVSWNHLTSISINAFATNSRLQKVNLKHNELTDIDGRVYSFLPKLEVLDKANNRISSIKRYAFEHHLKDLNMFGSIINCSCEEFSSIMSLNAIVRFASCILQEPFEYDVPYFMHNAENQWSAWTKTTPLCNSGVRVQTRKCVSCSDAVNLPWCITRILPANETCVTFQFDRSVAKSMDICNLSGCPNTFIPLQMMNATLSTKGNNKSIQRCSFNRSIQLLSVTATVSWMVFVWLFGVFLVSLG